MASTIDEDLKEQVEFFAKASRIPLILNHAYGKVRIYCKKEKGMMEVSPRLSKGNLRMWLDGFEKALELTSND